MDFVTDELMSIFCSPPFQHVSVSLLSFTRNVIPNVPKSLRSQMSRERIRKRERKIEMKTKRDSEYLGEVYKDIDNNMVDDVSNQQDHSNLAFDIQRNVGEGGSSKNQEEVTSSRSRLRRGTPADLSNYSTLELDH